MNNNLKKISLGIVAIATLLGLPVAGFYARGMYDQREVDSASKVASSFVADMTSGNTDAAYALTGKTVHQSPKALLVAYLGDLKTTKPILSKADIYRANNEVFYSQSVAGLPKTSTGRTDGTFAIRLQKEDGKWKVITVSVK